MDSPNEAASIRNPIKEGCEQEASKDSKSTNSPVDQLVGLENVFTSMSRERSTSFVPVNGSRPRVSDDSEQRLNRTKDNNLHHGNIGNIIDENQKRLAIHESNKVYNIESPCSSKVESASDKNFNTNCEKQACQRYKMYGEKVGNSSSVNGPSISGTNKSINNTESSNARENRKRPSTLKLDRPNIGDNDSSSDTGNDDYSLGSEDGCIYTYRGGEHLADLPSSFFSLDMGLPLDRHLPLLPNYPVPQQGAANAREQHSRASSPDMDFLEMDFDPGPSCEVDTDDESSPDVDLEVANSLPEETEPVIRGTTPDYLSKPVVNPQPSTSSSNNDAEHCLNVPSTSYEIEVTQTYEEGTGDQEYGPFITHVNFRGEQYLVRRTMSSLSSNTLSSLHLSNGDLVSPREVLNYESEQHEGAHNHLSSALYHITMTKRLMVQKTCSDVESHDAANVSVEQGAGCSSDGDTSCVEPPHRMVWLEHEACERQVTQIGTSACGATAVVNVFIALRVPVNVEKINAAVGTRLRANNAPIPRYLLSRAVAGCTAADLVNGIQRASDGLVTARFFPLHPERAMSLSHWLADWISLGAVPILTLNLQAGCEGEIPDAWHHQMVFGVSPRGIYLCNPCECVPERALWSRLTSPSVLLVRAKDIIARLTPNMDLSVLMAVPDRRFHTFNVLGQVASVIREWRARGWAEPGAQRCVRLPAAYQAGVTLAALTGSEAHRRLAHCPLPPLLGTVPKVSGGCGPTQ